MKAFISGSSRGIGKQIGIDLLDKDYFVYFNGHTQESTKELEKEIGYRDCNEDYSKTFSIICQDLSTIKQNIYLGNWFKENNVYFDALILNLGITDRTPFGEIKPLEWNKVLETNLSGAFFLVQTLKDNINRNGRIIFISSISGIVPDSTSISYGISKAGINMMVPYLSKEFASKKITVNAIAPGYTMTNWHCDKDNNKIRRIARKCLAKRFGEPKEVSKLVMSVIENDYINGQVLRIDGGFGL